MASAQLTCPRSNGTSCQRRPRTRSSGLRSFSAVTEMNYSPSPTRLAKDSITGYTVIQAENLDEAEKIAQGNPFIASIRVYELMTM